MSVDSPNGLRHRIFAGNLDFNTTKEQLYEAFSACGKIVDEIRLHQGYAFIQFENEESCLRAVSTLSGKQICGSKRIDVQMAKGPNHSAKKEGQKRKLDNRRDSSSNKQNYDNRDRGRDNTKKQKRTHESGNIPIMAQNPLLPSSVSPYSSANVGMVSVPIYIPDQSLENFANYVLQYLKSNGLTYHNVHIRNTNQGEQFFASPQFHQMIANEKFVIAIATRHEISRNSVSFKAVMGDGTSPGFADTPISDICTFILNNSTPPQVVPIYQNQYPFSAPPVMAQPTMAYPVQTLPATSFVNPQLPSGQPQTNYQRGNNNSRNNNRNNKRTDNYRDNRSSVPAQQRPSNNPSNSTSTPSQPSSGGTEEVKGLIIALLDTIGKQPTPSSRVSPSVSSTSAIPSHDIHPYTEDNQ